MLFRSAADREAAARLVERAAAHQGRWPAPPSPLPPSLSPPPGSAHSRSTSLRESLLELDKDGGLPQAPSSAHSIALKPIAQISPPVVAREKVSSPPPLLPPPKSSSHLGSSYQLKVQQGIEIGPGQYVPPCEHSLKDFAMYSILKYIPQRNWRTLKNRSLSTAYMR